VRQRNCIRCHGATLLSIVNTEGSVKEVYQGKGVDVDVTIDVDLEANADVDVDIDVD
jgi:hypothetical protein